MYYLENTWGHQLSGLLSSKTMKVILYTGLTINGFIAKKDGSTDWMCKEDFQDFDNMCRKIGVVVMGRKTWDEMNPNWLPFPQGDGTYLVLTRNSKLVSEISKTIYHLGAPEEAIELLKSQGHSEMLVIGGGETYGSFIQTGLVDELYIDIEPYLFGQGIPFFTEHNFEFKFELVEIIKLTANVVQLHYRVVK